MKASTRKALRDYGIAVVAAVTVAIVIRSFLIEAYRIPTPAMRPTLEPGDTIFVSKTPLGFNGKPRRGDVVVFSNPSDPDREYIKRVLAFPGEAVAVKQGHFSVNNKPVEFRASSPDTLCGDEILPPGRFGEAVRPEDKPRTFPICLEAPLNEDFPSERVPDDHVFVLGDLRSMSPLDVKKRKSWGIIPISSIIGRAEWVWLSIEPRTPRSPLSLPKFRFERMFRRIE